MHPTRPRPEAYPGLGKECPPHREASSRRRGGTRGPPQASRERPTTPGIAKDSRGTKVSGEATRAARQGPSQTPEAKMPGAGRVSRVSALEVEKEAVTGDLHNQGRRGERTRDFQAAILALDASEQGFHSRRTSNNERARAERTPKSTKAPSQRRTQGKAPWIVRRPYKATLAEL